MGSEGPELATVIIYSQDIERLAGFYAEAFSLSPFEKSEGHLGCQVGSIYLGFDRVETAASGSGGPTLWFTVDDLGATYHRLLELGAGDRYPPTTKPWGAELASVVDLDGNVLGLHQRGTG